MRRNFLIIAVVTLACAAVHTKAEAQVSADINIQLGKRPAPEVVFEREPQVVLIPRTRVYCIDGLDYDMFRFEGIWYVNDGGYWYRSRTFRGPFVAVDYHIIPRSIVVLPTRYHHHPLHPHGGPPGQMKKAQGHSKQQDRDMDKRGGRKMKGGRH